MKSAGISVLIVDDSPIIYQRLKLLLKEVERVQSILYAGSFGDAEQILGQERVDIVLLDIHLPGKNGFDLLKVIKKEYPSIKVIVTTNYVDDHYIKLSKKLKADHFIDKSKDFKLIPGLIAGLTPG
jgi:DNA-binding NarL/FixJ family response regulator